MYRLVRQLFTALFVLLMVGLTPGSTMAQEPTSATKQFYFQLLDSGGPASRTKVMPPEEILSRQAQIPSHRIVVVFPAGFPEDAKPAFEYGAKLWASYIDSLGFSIPIRIFATWQPLPVNSLASLSFDSRYNFDNAPRMNTWYPTALANNLAGIELNPGAYDIVVAINSQENWYLGTDGNPEPNQYDLVTTMMRAVGVGLGLASSFDVANGVGSWGVLFPSLPNAMDHFVVNGAGQSLIDENLFPNDSLALATALTNDDVYFSGLQATAANGNARPRLYAPNPFVPSRSIEKLDEDAFPPGDINSLMTPVQAPEEVIHQPGPVAIGMLLDIGWSDEPRPPAPTHVQAEAISDTEISLTWVNQHSDAEAMAISGVGEIPVDSTSYTVTGLDPGSTHCYHLSVIVNRMVSPDSNEACATTSVVPTANLSIVSVEPVQVLEGTDLVRGKATAIKVVVGKTGPDSVDNVSVQVDYISSDDPFSSTVFHVYDQGNLDDYHRLVNNNSVYPLNFPAGGWQKTIYFFDDNFTPTTIDSVYLVAATVTDDTPENNHATSTSHSVVDTVWTDSEKSPGPELKMHYIRADWSDPPNLKHFEKFAAYSHRFLEGVVPVAEDQFSYETSDSVLRGIFSFPGIDIADFQLTDAMRKWYKSMKRAHPDVDRFVVVVEHGWFEGTQKYKSSFGVYLGGTSRGLMLVEDRFKDRPNNAQIVGHEWGHSNLLPKIHNVQCTDGTPEDYLQRCNQLVKRFDLPGGLFINVGSYSDPGLWVEQKMPIANDPPNRPVFAFMGASRFEEGVDVQFWIDENDYQHLLNERSARVGRQANLVTSQSIIATGVLSKTGPATLDDWLLIDGQAAYNISEPGPYSIDYLDADETLLYQLPFSVDFEIDALYEAVTEVDEIPFMFTIPFITDTQTILIKHEDEVLAERVISQHAPTVEVTSPNGGEQINGQATITWSASDTDGDAMSYLLYFSADNGTTWNPLAAGITEPSYVWNLSQVPAGQQYLVKVVASDGFNVGEDVSDAVFEVVVSEPSLFLPLLVR